ncbi:hypothetical protein D6C92_10615 [Aureobasidium pullulans]|nr:hypothetical protein D6C92_10615 [Aureobasidium pullulans]
MALRPGILCHASPLRFDRQTKHEVMGGMNIHVNVEFQDGVTWLARIRRSNATSPPPVVRDYIILSEIATLQFLENVNVPTPRLLGYALEADEGNNVGVGYMFILIDNDYTITGIIDWEWAFSAPCTLSFNSPLVLLDLVGFYAGSPAISPAESYFADALEAKGGTELAESVRGGRTRRFFEFCCGYDVYTDWEGFKRLFGGLRRCVGVYGELEWEEWRKIVLKRYKEDRGVLQLMV